MKTKELVKNDYTEYAYAVLEDRHFPNIIDGLKPGMRRTVWTAYVDGHTWKSKFTKSARIVGQVMARFHPHGDSAIYEAIVNHAGVSTDSKYHYYSRRSAYPIFEGYGNFGSLDDKSYSAHRYTECRLSKIAQYLFHYSSITKTTSNYLNDEVEPIYLPAVLPYLLLNGVSGTGVGAVTNIPMHNMSEVCDVLLWAMKYKKSPNLKQIMKYIKGPDYPSGGIIENTDEIKTVYKTGKGTISYKLNLEWEALKNETFKITCTGIPPGFNLENWLNKLNEMKDVKDVKVIDIRYNIHIEITVKGRKTRDTILNTKFTSKNQWNVLIRTKDTKPKFKSINIVEFFDYWLKYIIKETKRYWKWDVIRLQGEIRRCILRIRIAQNIEKVIPLVKAEKWKALKKLLKTDDEGIDILKRTTLGSLAKTNEEAQWNRLNSLKDEFDLSYSNYKNPRKPLKKLFKDAKKYSYERRTIVND